MKKKLSILFLSLILIIFTSFHTIYAAGAPNWITIKQSDFDNSELVIKQEGLSGFAHGGREVASNPGWYRYWRKVSAGETQTFEYSNVGWYNGKPIGARVTVSPSQGFLYVDTIFENGYMAASQEHMQAGNYASQLKGSIKYEYYYMSDSSKAAINLSDALFTICSNSGDEYIANLSNNSAPVYRSSDSELKWKENGGNTYVGNVTSQHYDDFNSPTLAKTTAGWVYSGTSFTVGYWGDQSRGYFFAPSTYKFNLNEGYAKVKYVDVTGGNEVELSQTGVFKGSSDIKVLSKYTNYSNDLNSYLSNGYSKVSSELDSNPSFTNGTSIQKPRVYVVKLQRVGWAKVEFIDKTNNNEILEEKAGIQGIHDSLVSSAYTTKTQDIEYWTDRGYKLVSDGFDTNPKFTSGQTITIKIVLEHTYTPVDKRTFDPDKCLNIACTIKMCND